MARLLDVEEIDRQLAALPGWARDGASLRRAYELPDFLTAIRGVEDIAVHAEAMDHHPDIDIRWRTLRFTLSTHSAGGVTQLDVELAHQIHEVLTRLGAT